MANKMKYFILLLATCTLCACSDGYEELGYTPSAIGDNSHTADWHNTNTDDKGKDDGGNTDGQTGTLAEKLGDTYTGFVQVTVDGVSNTPTEQTISIEKVDDDHINFTLKNFMLVSGNDVMPVGTIKLENIALQQEGDNILFSVTRDIYIQAGDADITTDWLGPILGAVPVELKGIGNKDQLDIDIDINMVSLMQIIHVDFYTEK